MENLNAKKINQEQKQAGMGGRLDDGLIPAWTPEGKIPLEHLKQSFARLQSELEFGENAARRMEEELSSLRQKVHQVRGVVLWAKGLITSHPDFKAN